MYSSMSYRLLRSRRDGRVEHLTLNRPDVRNAFNEHVIAELTAWARTRREPIAGCASVVISGAGKVFCAGADVDLDGEDGRLLATTRTCATRARGADVPARSTRCRCR